MDMLCFNAHADRYRTAIDACTLRSVISMMVLLVYFGVYFATCQALRPDFMFIICLAGITTLIDSGIVSEVQSHSERLLSDMKAKRMHKPYHLDHKWKHISVVAAVVFWVSVGIHICFILYNH